MKHRWMRRVWLLGALPYKQITHHSYMLICSGEDIKSPSLEHVYIYYCFTEPVSGVGFPLVSWNLRMLHIRTCPTDECQVQKDKKTKQNKKIVSFKLPPPSDCPCTLPQHPISYPAESTGNRRGRVLMPVSFRFTLDQLSNPPSHLQVTSGSNILGIC